MRILLAFVFVCAAWSARASYWIRAVNPGTTNVNVRMDQKSAYNGGGSWVFWTSPQVVNANGGVVVNGLGNAPGTNTIELRAVWVVGGVDVQTDVFVFSGSSGEFTNTSTWAGQGPPEPSLCWSVGPWVNNTTFVQDVDVRRYGTGAGLQGVSILTDSVPPGGSVNWAVTNACPVWVQVHYTSPVTEAPAYDTPSTFGTNVASGGSTNSSGSVGTGNIFDPNLNNTTGGANTPSVGAPTAEPRTNDFGSSIEEAIKNLNANQEARHKEQLAQDRSRAGADQTNANTALNLDIQQHAQSSSLLRSIRDAVKEVNSTVASQTNQLGYLAAITNAFNVGTNGAGGGGWGEFGTNVVPVPGGVGGYMDGDLSQWVTIPEAGSDSVLMTIPFGAFAIEGLDDVDVDFAHADFGSNVTMLRGVMLLVLTGLALWSIFRILGKAVNL